jgi:hypothetical protein
MIGFIDTPITITLNYNQLQQLTIKRLPRTRSILVLLSQILYNFCTPLAILMCPPFMTSGWTE